jgi:hypothetical protein
MKAFLSAHKFTILSAVLAVLLAGCSLFPVRTVSPVSGTKVNRTQLNGEAKVTAEKFAAATADLDQKEQVRAEVLTAVKSVISAAVPPGYADILTSGLAALSIGATVDNVLVRKRSSTSEDPEPEPVAPDPHPTDPANPVDPATGEREATA